MPGRVPGIFMRGRLIRARRSRFLLEMRPMCCAGALEAGDAPGFFGIDLACHQVLKHP
jgi:hypothetical protein